MRLALLSDIHGNLLALEAVVADLRRRGADQVVNLGDCLSGPLLPRETAQYLMAQGWITLAGNHERQVLNEGPRGRGASDAHAHAQLTAVELAWLQSLSPTHRLTPDVFLCHGTPDSDITYFLESVDAAGMRLATADEVEQRLGTEDAALIACGHTHIPRIVRSRSGQLIVNPGSVGLPAYDDDRPYPHVAETGSPDARYAIAEKTDGRWHVSAHAVSYDHEAMARLADQRGRPDWAVALRTGRMSTRAA